MSLANTVRDSTVVPRVERAMTASSEEQIREYVERCPEQNRWAFEGWLRGTHQLDGDVIDVVVQDNG
jgi:hypothetical protein